MLRDPSRKQVPAPQVVGLTWAPKMGCPGKRSADTRFKGFMLTHTQIIPGHPTLQTAALVKETHDVNWDPPDGLTNQPTHETFKVHFNYAKLLQLISFTEPRLRGSPKKGSSLRELSKEVSPLESLKGFIAHPLLLSFWET